jgi:two-component system response regulator RegA
MDELRMPVALVVEDDVALGKLLCHSLTKAGITAICVFTAEEASIELASKPIDYCLIDVTLPGTSGLYVIEAIRQLEKVRRPTVILMTATRANILDKIDRSVVKAVMFKPLNVEALVAFVARLKPLPAQA